MDFASVLDSAAARYPERVALSLTGRHVTFADFQDRASRLAGSLAELGLAPGDRFATLLPNGLDLATVLFAANRAELIAVPIMPRFGPAQVEYILKHSGARLLVTTAALLAKVSAEARGGLDATVLTDPADGMTSLAELLTGPPAPARRRSPDPIGLLVYTSGTTSRPKGVAHSQRRMARRTALFADEMGLTPDDVTIATGDLGRPVVLLGQLLAMAQVGGRVALLPAADPPAFWAAYA